MRPEDLIAFMGRDWPRIARMKESRSELRPIEALELGDGLRRDVARRRPDWPSQRERDEDLATHARVSEALRRARFL